MTAMLRRRWRRLRAHRDRGAVTVLFTAVAAALFLMVGLSVDGGGRMRALERADDIAAEAARAAGQALDLPQAVTGTADVINRDRAVAAGQAYIRAAGAEGTIEVLPGNRSVRATVSVTYQPIFLGLLLLGPWTETSTETATLLTG